jgi:serine/threonine protein kinase
MELGDSAVPDWEQNPSTYQPCNLAVLLAQTPGRKLPVTQCLDISITLAETLSFLHRNNLTHRDIKPQNIIFVKGGPKLADIGLVTEIRPQDYRGSRPGTPGFMPPAPEPVGTIAADLYGLGMVLYVCSTGKNPDLLPIVPTTLLQDSGNRAFFRLNPVILKACNPAVAERYGSADEMRAALFAVKASLA